MKYYLLIISLLFSVIVCSQVEDKKPYMFDENGKAIGEKEFFSKLKSGVYFKRAVVNDTAVLAKLYVRKFEGQLDTASYSIFINHFEKTVKTKIDTTKPLVVYFFYESDKRLAKHYANTERLKELNNSEVVQTFYMTEKGFHFKNRKHIFYEDSLDLVKQTFISPHNCCGSAVVLKPNGEYYKELGEFNSIKITEKALSDW
ncbi:hypothetical protein [Formosa maritima]|uniref:Uncharacterized protein n=1 Tax=Formosa maritima TaxID=2592046 RepID=A0A5D0GMF7_9FLAO|nr:hypothetical protein [Formosa maritima]TYA58867.1 hypothetical protein FVF61_01570 [Formosa maritima]